jgi:hypothetical protein
MSEGETPGRDGYIAVRKAELIQALAEQGLGADEARAFADLARVLSALLHHEAHERLEALKALYDPLDPDAPASRRNTGVAAFEAFEAAMVEALARANFTEVEADSVQTRDATKLITDLSIKPSNAGIRRVRFFARGVRQETLSVKRFMGLRTQGVDAEMMNDVVVLVGFKAEDEVRGRDRAAFTRMRRGVRPGAAIVKHFRNVAAPELVTLHPGATPAIRARDQVMLAGPAVVAGTPVLLNLWPALTVLAAVVGSYFTAGAVIDNEGLTRAVAALGGLVALVAFLMRQRLKLEATTLRYHKRLADTVYFRNIANNHGVLDLVMGAGEEQDVKEALLGFWALRTAARALSSAEIDAACEAFLRGRFGLAINFEIGDAVAKLERLGLVTREGETYAAISSTDALARLDAAWDGVFRFARA